MPAKGSRRSWVAVTGKWSFEGDVARYLAPGSPEQPFGIALSSERVRKGNVSVSVALSDREKGAGRILFGYDARSTGYFTAGLGGHGMAYLVDEYVPGSRWQALRGHGSWENLPEDRAVPIRLGLQGQRVELSASEIKLVSDNLPHPLLGDQVGLFAWGTSETTFSDFRVSAAKPQAFVIMQFGEPYDSFHRRVVIPVTDKLGLVAVRGDDIYGPGIILNDIIRHIEQADIIVAEITPVNANVFYELGYAHALQKPVILLAEKSVSLPFDIRGYRCILYDDSIAGKSEVEDALRKHLSSILSEWGYVL